MAKSADAFRTISEVAEWLETPAHVLRFWESKFTQVKPVKRAGGRRYYRPADMELLGGIKQLLHEDGMTIKGVQKLLRERGVTHVAALSPRQVIPGEAPAAADPAPAPSSAPVKAPPSAPPVASPPVTPPAEPAPEAPAEAPLEAVEEPTVVPFRFSHRDAEDAPANDAPVSTGVEAGADHAGTSGDLFDDVPEAPAPADHAAPPSDDTGIAAALEIDAEMQAAEADEAPVADTPATPEPAAATAPRPLTIDLPADPADGDVIASPGLLRHLTARSLPLTAEEKADLAPLVQSLSAWVRKDPIA
ncbi:MerR family transcriptional regulator [Pseudooceanicola sp. LIPI14-2-Ac024]|uniref:MerR family transcriptional regulator n=1 Tax=Pseudooceanicola sp. LIPI14-2-Ac024 TaxID=3344875 RepID=UPI0035D099B2